MHELMSSLSLSPKTCTHFADWFLEPEPIQPCSVTCLVSAGSHVSSSKNSALLKTGSTWCLGAFLKSVVAQHSMMLGSGEMAVMLARSLPAVPCLVTAHSKG